MTAADELEWREQQCQRCQRRDPEHNRCTPCGCFCAVAQASAAKECPDPDGSRWGDLIRGPERILHAGGWLGPPIAGPGVWESWDGIDLAVAVITAPRPVPTLRDTLDGLRRAGFRQSVSVFAEPGAAVEAEIATVGPVEVHRNAATLGNVRNYLAAARHLLGASAASWLMICEDDVELSEAAGGALAAAIRTADRPGMLSLYSPRHNLGPSPRTPGWHRMNRAGQTWGALAWVFPREVLAAVVEALGDSEAPDGVDQLVAHAVAKTGRTSWTHYPSLGRHIGFTSSMRHGQKEGFEALAYHPDYSGYRLREQPVRVGFLTPNILCGGVERWLHGTIQAATGASSWRVWLANDKAQEGPMVRALTPFATLCTGPEALAWVKATSDVLVAWGLPELPQLVEGFRGPVVLISHGGPEHAWTRTMLAAAAPGATHLAAVSTTAAHAFGKHEARGVRVIPNGYQPARVRGGRSRAEVRKSWQMATDIVAVGFVGRLAAEKRPEQLARATAWLRKNDPRKWRAVFIGPEYDRAMRDRIKAFDPLAVFVAPVDHVGEAFAALDVGFSASVSEGFGLSNLEMLAAGLPMVSTRVGFIPQLEAAHGECVVPIRLNSTPEEMATAIRLALSPARRDVVERARQAVYGWTADESAAQWESFLIEVNNGSRKRV